MGAPRESAKAVAGGMRGAFRAATMRLALAVALLMLGASGCDAGAPRCFLSLADGGVISHWGECTAAELGVTDAGTCDGGSC